MKNISKLNLNLIRAARKGFNKVVDKFITDGADRMYLEEENQINALRAAIENNDQDAINILIEAGVTLPTEEENQINTPGTEIENNNPNTIILKEAGATQTANHAPRIPDMDFSNTIFPQLSTPPLIPIALSRKMMIMMTRTTNNI